MVLGDSLQVMTSLAYREDLCGKVQMIYFDPPYGIKFASNFQPEMGKRDVKDKDSDLTREIEMVRAYRDTWTLGVHSYLGYLRDRLMAAKVLLKDTGSIFLQISDENMHRVRMVMDEVFGAENFIATIAVKKTGSKGARYVDAIIDNILWYARDSTQTKYNELFIEKEIGIGKGTGERYDQIAEKDGSHRAVSKDEKRSPILLNKAISTGSKPFQLTALISESSSSATTYEVDFGGKRFSRNNWKTSKKGFERLIGSERIAIGDTTLRYVRFLNDFAANPLANFWDDTGLSDKIYVVQTSNAVIERCMLMTTEPGDLVIDPTCGSGTTAYVAEQWGRRWITMDTSRVALALARQRLLTAKFELYKMAEPAPAPNGDEHSILVTGKFKYKTVPRVTLKSIAQNTVLDPIFAKHEPILAARLAVLNAALAAHVTPELRAALAAKLAAKQKQEGKTAVSEADRRRWLLPVTAWQPWEVPFDAASEWPAPLAEHLLAYRQVWRAKQEEVDAAIEANAEIVELVNKPYSVPGFVRVSGPFDVEGVFPIETSPEMPSPIGGAPEESLPGGLVSFPNHRGAALNDAPANAAAFRDEMLRLLRMDGVRFPNNKELSFVNLDAVNNAVLHATGTWQPAADMAGPERRVVVSFGPQYGNVTADQVAKGIRAAFQRGADDLLFVGFGFDAAAQAAIEEAETDGLNLQLVTIRPDVAMGKLLKDTPNAQLFTSFGKPRARLEAVSGGQYRVHMEGVDIYDPVKNVVLPTHAGKVAAWFLDADYNGLAFCVTQAFFPDKKAWDKLAKALKGQVNQEDFAQLSGTVSLPFTPGDQGRAAVKVIDPRGNEVLCLVPIPNAGRSN